MKPAAGVIFAITFAISGAVNAGTGCKDGLTGYVAYLSYFEPTGENSRPEFVLEGDEGNTLVFQEDGSTTAGATMYATLALAYMSRTKVYINNCTGDRVSGFYTVINP
jgi:hypothetical protein